MATTFTEWMRNQYDNDELRDITEHGMDAGFSGLIYTTECCRVFDQYADEIWDLARETADSIGAENVADMIADFRRSDLLESWDQFRNLMVWFAAEEIARQLVDEIDSTYDGQMEDHE